MKKAPEKNHKTEAENAVQSSRLKNAGWIALYAAAGVVLLLGLFVSFLQFNTFQVKAQTGKGINAYLAERDVLQNFSAAEDGFSLALPLEVVSEEMLKQALEKEKNIFNAEFDLAAKKAMINYKVQGFYVPVLYSVTAAEETPQIGYYLQPKGLGKSGLPLPGWLFSLLAPVLETSLPQGIWVPEEAFGSYGWEADSWKQAEAELVVKLTLAGAALDELMTELKGLTENEVKYIFEKGTSGQKKTVELLASYPASADELKSVLASSYFEEEPVFKNLLLLMDSGLMEKTLEYYPFIRNQYSVNELLKEKSDLIARSISSYGIQILKAAEAWMEVSGGEFYNNGYPFLKKEQRTVTAAEVVEKWDLPISESMVRRLHFGLDMADKKLAVLYIVDLASYAVIKADGYFVVDEKTYLARYQKEMPPVGAFTQDFAIWRAVSEKLKTSFKTEQLFIRYMKDDGKDAFLLLSFLEKPQDVQAVTFSKIGEEWLPTASNFKDINELQAQDPSFNLNLYTDIYEDPRLIYIDENALENIEEELSYAGKLPAGERPVYYSYKDKYIYVKLSSGEEYLLTTYHQYLDKIYTRQNALALFGDVLPQIILLQEAPQPAAPSVVE